MSDDAASEIARMEALRARFVPVSPDYYRPRLEPDDMDPRVVVSLPVGLPDFRLVYMSEFAHSKGWVVYIHPDGSLYLHNPGERAVMEYPVNEKAFDKIVVETTMCMTALCLAFEQLPPESRPNRDDCELFLRVEQKSRAILYYFVDYTRRHVFWAQEHILGTPFTAFAQLASALQSQFWRHVERFPAHRCLPKNAREELHSILAYQVIDVTTNALSTSPYLQSDIVLFIKTLKGTRESSAAIDGALNALIARLWGEQCRVRTHNLHGAPQVRLERTERRGTIAMEPPHRCYQLIGLFLLFNEPYGFYNSLMDVFVDEVIYERLWSSLYQDTLLKEWSGHAFMATVTLTANMAFLAVGNVGGGNGSNDTLSPSSQVLSLCSTMFSIGAIVIGTSLPNIHRRYCRLQSPNVT